MNRALLCKADDRSWRVETIRLVKMPVRSDSSASSSISGRRLSTRIDVSSLCSTSPCAA